MNENTNYEFQTIGTVEKVEEPSAEANVLIEEGGEVKRVSVDKVGGSGSPTGLIVDLTYSSAGSPK